MDPRAARIAEFLDAAGWGAARRAPLAGDASFRRYLRLTAADGRRAVLMDAPPPQEDVRPFWRIADLLRGLGFRAPSVLAGDVEAGLLLLEDLGDTTLASALAAGTVAPAAAYRLATDTLIALHRAWAAAPGPSPALPGYDTALLIDGEAMLLVDWYLPAVARPVDAEARAAYAEAWRTALTAAGDLPHTLVLRDYFPDNLMLLAPPPADPAPAGAAARACGLLDFQDAVRGPRPYDLMSLLQDARRDVPEAIEEAMLRRYLEAFDDLDPAAFRRGYAVLAAQRHAKVLGIFTRLAHRDGKPGYLAHVPRLWRLLTRALAEPALAPVATWLEWYLPPAARVTPATRVTPAAGAAGSGEAPA